MLTLPQDLTPSEVKLKMAINHSVELYQSVVDYSKTEARHAAVKKKRLNKKVTRIDSLSGARNSSETAIEYKVRRYDTASRVNRKDRKHHADMRANNAVCKPVDENFIEGNNFGGIDPAEEALAIRDAVSDRMRHGYVRDAGEIYTTAGPREIKKISFKGLMSNRTKLIRLFIASLSRQVMAGDSPRRLRRYTRPGKVLALDMPYVDGNDAKRGYFGIQLHKQYRNFDDMEKLLYARNIVMPTVCVFTKVTGDRIENPCLIWMLEQPVNFTETGRRQPKRVYDTIIQGLYEALRSEGAQSACLENPMIVMNPASPVWDTVILNDKLHSLANIGKTLPRKLTKDAEFAMDYRKYALTHKNGFYSAVLQFVIREVRVHYASDNRDAFEDKVRSFTFKLGKSLRKEFSEVKNVSQKLINWCWANHDPEKVLKYQSRVGPCAHLTRDVAIPEAKSIGGHYTSGKLHSRAVRLIMTAGRMAIKQTKVLPDAKQIAKMLGGLRSVRTVQRYMNEVREELCIFLSDLLTPTSAPTVPQITTATVVAGVISMPINLKCTLNNGTQHVKDVMTSIVRPLSRHNLIIKCPG